MSDQVTGSLTITEHRNEYGAVGLQIGGGPVRYGYDLADVAKVLDALVSGDVSAEDLPAYGPAWDLDADDGQGA